MAWIISFHIIFVVAWFAGLFYLPRLYVYHADSTDAISLERFKVMERNLFYGIMTPAGILASVFGLWVLSFNPAGYWQQGWVHAKLGLVVLLWVYHIYCGKLLGDFKRDQNRFGSKFYRFFNEIPTILLIAIVILVVVKPG